MRARSAIAVLVMLGAVQSAGAAALTPGDILISAIANGPVNMVEEFTPTGSLVESFRVPTPQEVMTAFAELRQIPPVMFRFSMAHLAPI